MSTSTIAPLSNRADWTGTINILEAGEQVDTSEAMDLVIELEDPDTKTAVLTGSLGSGVTAQDTTKGVYTFAFAAPLTANLKQKNYWFAGLIKTPTQTLQLFKVQIPAYDGIVG